MAQRCFLYFSFDCFNERLNEDQIIQNIMNGNFSWLEYAEKYWLDHAKGATKALDSTYGPKLTGLIIKHIRRWSNDELPTGPTSGFDFGLGDYKAYSESVYTFLRRSALLRSQGSRTTKINGE